MHKSRLGAIVIDCNSDDFARDVAFWSALLGGEARPSNGPDMDNYAVIETPPGEIDVLLQKVDHPSRVHLDVETDDQEKEVARLEALGAKRVAQIKSWWVMEAPSGHRFCVVQPQRPDFETGAKPWD